MFKGGRAGVVPGQAFWGGQAAAAIPCARAPLPPGRDLKASANCAAPQLPQMSRYRAGWRAPYTQKKQEGWARAPDIISPSPREQKKTKPNRGVPGPLKTQAARPKHPDAHEQTAHQLGMREQSTVWSRERPVLLSLGAKRASAPSTQTAARSARRATAGRAMLVLLLLAC